MPQTELLRILVVDDNRDNADIISQYLGTVYNYPISVAYDGDEALRLFEAEKPAIVLLDVMMPGRDGWDVCRAMKGHPNLGHRVRVIMVTALGGLGDKRTALQTGADDFLEKPLDFVKLATAVRRNAEALALTAA